MDKRMEMQQKIQSIKEEMVGFRYRHFKGGVYIVSDIAVHSETEEPMVIYKSFDNPTLVWARPLSMFMSEVDHAKYPDVKQKFRFERMDGETSTAMPQESAYEPIYSESPMPLEKQWTLCDENGMLEGNIFVSHDLIYKSRLDEDELMDLMSERLTGDPGMDNLKFCVLGETTGNQVVVRVRGNIAERTEFGEELDDVCERIKSAVMKKGDDVISDFLGMSVTGKTREEIEQEIDADIELSPILTLIREFKKYVLDDSASESANSAETSRPLSGCVDMTNTDHDFTGPLQKKFPIVGLQFNPEYYMTSDGLMRLLKLLDTDEFEIVQVDGTANTSSYFLFSSEVYEDLEVKDLTEFETFIREILDDINKENPDDQYMWRDHRVYLGYL